MTYCLLVKHGDFTLLHHGVHTGSGTHPASYSIGIADFFPGVKRTGRDADHSTLSSVDTKNAGAIPPIPHTSSQHST
jgi:hypothetical protein